MWKWFLQVSEFHFCLVSESVSYFRIELHTFLATGCQTFFKAGSEHKLCNSCEKRVTREVASGSQVKVGRAVRWVDARTACRSGLFASTEQWASLFLWTRVHRRKAEANPTLGCLYLSMWLLWGKGRRIFLTVSLPEPPPQSWQETQTFQSLKDDLHQYFVKMSTKNVKIRRTRAPRTLNPASLRCPATLTLAYCFRGNHVLKTKGKSKVPNHTRKGIRPGEPGISCQVMELFSLRPSFYFCYRPKPVKMRVCKIRSDL